MKNVYNEQFINHSEFFKLFSCVLALVLAHCCAGTSYCQSYLQNNTTLPWTTRTACQLRQDKHQDMRRKRQKLTSTSWLRPVCGGFHNFIRFKCAPFFASCRRHRVLTVTCLHACRCAAYLTDGGFAAFTETSDCPINLWLVQENWDSDRSVPHVLHSKLFQIAFFWFLIHIMIPYLLVNLWIDKWEDDYKQIECETT
jgi:hypothetical protein